MHAAVAPAVRARWELKDVPVSDPGPNQVLIRIRASGLCYTDVHQTNGELPGPFPRILGHEPVGEIVALGPGVRTRRVGDRDQLDDVNRAYDRVAQGKVRFRAVIVNGDR